MTNTTEVIAGKADVQDVITEVLWKQFYNRDKAGVPKSREAARAIWLALCSEGLVEGQKATSGEDALAALRHSVTAGRIPFRGTSHHIAQALVLLDLPTVHRHVLEYLLPDVPGSSKDARTTVVKAACRKFSAWGWIKRDDNGLIAVLDSDALAQWFEIAEEADERRAASTLDVVGAVQRLNKEIRSGNTDELRERELIALQRLMQTAPGSITNERGNVRLVAKPNLI